MKPLRDKFDGQRAIINRRALAETIDTIIAEHDGSDARPAIRTLLQKALADGRAEIASRLEAEPTEGHRRAAEQAHLIDQLIRLIYDYVTGHLHPIGNASRGERLSLHAVGGYGRGEMASHSDVDLAFITPYKRTGWTEQVVEAVLYLLWDLGLKVGHSSRSLDEMVKLARDDITIRTSLLEARFIWGDRALYDEAASRFWNDVVAGTVPNFIAQKIEERDERHRRMGDSRYVVEPNVKEGKGGLRDLQTLYWIGKYMYRVQRGVELVAKGLFTRSEYRKFRRAENFLWAVRCHLHTITNRPEDRLTFDLQREVAERMGYGDRAGASSVERFMKFYFTNAKTVGDLTGLFLSHLEEAQAKRLHHRFTRRPKLLKKLNGFQLDQDRIAIPDDAFFQDDPVRLIEMFSLADRFGYEVHPLAMRAARRDAKSINHEVRKDPRANELFLSVLSSPRDPAKVLRWMNEATVFGRFVPEFGRVVAQMQFDMYHHYTVDEHTIRAIGLLSDIESGRLADDHPLATDMLPKLKHRRVLYVATLLHDIAKGRGGDHSVLGAEIALKLCPRLGLDESETELVSWLVRYHLLMSATAFKRDLADYKTIADFTDQVQSVERLKLLILLTIVDIRAVGPGVWNSWKRQLLGDLYTSAEELMRLGHKAHGRAERIEDSKAALRGALDISDAAFDELADRFPDAYWIAEPDDIVLRNARDLLAAGDAPLSIDACFYPERGATLISVYAADHAGLFYRIVGAIHLAGASVIDARVHTTTDGMAMDNFLVQDPHGRPFRDEGQIQRLREAIVEALTSRARMAAQLEQRPMPFARADAFVVAPFVVSDNDASNRFTVIEVNARDRPALLNSLAQALFRSKAVIRSAHIMTYGERAVDTFYVTDLLGDKITGPQRLKTLEGRLLEAAKGELDEALQVA